MVAFFAIWRSTTAEKWRQFNCDNCIAAKNKYYKSRKCFIQPWKKRSARQKKLLIPVPLFDDTGTRRRDHNQEPLREDRWLARDDFIDTLVETQSRLPYLNIWQIHQSYFKDVCPRAFYDFVMDALTSAESSVDQYKGAIGDLSEEEVRENLLGFRISYEDLFSAFDSIRSVRNEYKRMETEEAQAKHNAQTNSPAGNSRQAGSRRSGAPKKVMGE